MGDGIIREWNLHTEWEWLKQSYELFHVSPPNSIKSGNNFKYVVRIYGSISM